MNIPIDIEIDFAYVGGSLGNELRNTTDTLALHRGKTSEYTEFEKSAWAAEESMHAFYSGGRKYIAASKTLGWMLKDEPEVWQIIDTALHTTFALFSLYEVWRSVCRWKKRIDAARAAGETVAYAIAQMWTNIAMAIVASVITYAALHAIANTGRISAAIDLPSFDITIPYERRKGMWFAALAGPVGVVAAYYLGPKEKCTTAVHIDPKINPGV